MYNFTKYNLIFIIKYTDIWLSFIYSNNITIIYIINLIAENRHQMYQCTENRHHTSV